MCDTTDWDENANIGAKYLRVARSVIKLPYEKTNDTTDQIMHYETIAIVI